MHTFGKQEHLCSIPEIQKLFHEGKSFFRHPVKLYWLPGNWAGKPVAKVIVSVSKRNFKKAVDRNFIKRLLRECYRRNKVIVEDGLTGKRCIVALVYSGKEIPEFKSLEPIIIKLLERLVKEYETTAG
ncbi:MAG: ribonuclease P protein component [Bacteroidales bacterium]|nr:ribonuclease P protein component [Bacteroidales bacterium]